MPMMHEEVHQRAGEQDQEGQDAQEVLPVIGQQQQGQTKGGRDDQPKDVDPDLHAMAAADHRGELPRSEVESIVGDRRSPGTAHKFCAYRGGGACI